MNDWTEGYVTDIDYGYRYVTLLNPGRARFAFLNCGLAFPKVEHACELGFGQGLSVGIHAAASTVQWYGTDFIPAQAEFAQAMATASGSGARLFADSFDAFCHRSDLPDFDFIGLHGVWSWISDANRRIIVDFLARKLKEGGVLYISYNTLPGWGDFISTRYLMTRYMAALGEQHTAGRIKKVVDFVDKFITTTKPRHYQVNPLLAGRMDELRNSDARYLAHEYFNRDWCPMHFSELADWLHQAGIQYACPAYYLDHIVSLNLTEEQRAFLQDVSDPVLRELLYDFATNQEFRTDYWIKGAPRRITVPDQASILQRQQYILTTPREDILLTVNGKLGQWNLRAEIYAPILDLMSDYAPHTLEQLGLSVSGQDITPAQLYQCIMVLMGMRHVDAVQTTVHGEQIRGQCKRLNAFLCDHSRQGKDITFLASPITGGSVEVSRLDQLFLTSIGQGKTQPQNWAEYALHNLSNLGERLVKDGRTLGMEDEKRAELQERAATFAQKRLPVLKSLGIA